MRCMGGGGSKGVPHGSVNNQTFLTCADFAECVQLLPHLFPWLGSPLQLWGSVGTPKVDSLLPHLRFHFQCFSAKQGL